MKHHDGIEPHKFSLSLSCEVIEIVLLYRRQDGVVYCVTELLDLSPAPLNISEEIPVSSGI